MIGSIKKLVSLVLIVSILSCSFSLVGFAEEVPAIPQGVSDVATSDAENSSGNKVNFFLEGKDITGQIENEIELDSTGISDMSLQIAGVTATVIPAADTFAVGDNTPPVAELYPVVMNEETLKEGFPTVLTQIAFFWQVGDISLTYDPDGDMIANIFVAGVTNETIKAVTADGFAVQFSAPGTYNLLYQVQDIRGAYSNIVQYEITVVPIDNINVFKGTIDSTGAEQTFETTIQLSDIGSDTMVLTLVQYNFQEVTAELYDSTGAKVTSVMSSYLYDDIQGASRAKRRATFPTPQSSTGTASYTIKVSGKPYSKFEVAIGGVNAIGDMLGGIDHAVPILKHNINHDRYNFYAINGIGYTPNTFEDFFKFYTNGDNFTITLKEYSDIKNLHFKVFSQGTLTLEYDSYADLAKSVKIDQIGVIKRHDFQNLPQGDYYVVIYTPEDLRPSTEPSINNGGYDLLLGDPFLDYGYKEIVGYPHSYSANSMVIDEIDTSSFPESAILWGVLMQRHSGDSVPLSQFKDFRIRAKYNGVLQPWVLCGMYNNSIGYGDVPGRYPAVDRLQFGLTLSQSKSSLTNIYKIGYFFERGDPLR